MGVTIFLKWLPPSHCDDVMGVTIFSKWLPPSHCDEGNYSISLICPVDDLSGQQHVKSNLPLTIYLLYAN